MAMNNNREARALLKSVGEDGTCWLFVFLSEDRWAITRDGKQFAVGATDRAGIGSGVEKFLSLTRARVSSDAACDPAVAAQLGRIERGRSSAAKVAKSQGRISPHAPKEASAYLTTNVTAGP